VVAQVVGGDPVAQIAYCNGINVEVWESGEPLKERNAQTDRTLRERNLGAILYQGLYAPAYTSFVSAHHRALSENTLQLRNGARVRTLDTFPADGSTTTEDLSGWCNDETDFCCTEEERNSMEWNVSTCIKGRWCVSGRPRTLALLVLQDYKVAVVAVLLAETPVFRYCFAF
jgi:hypothetical protein